jgi:hypothetical protein
MKAEAPIEKAHEATEAHEGDAHAEHEAHLTHVLHQLHIYVWADVAVRFGAISCFSSRVVGQPQL